MITNERRAYKRVNLKFDVNYCSLSRGKTVSGNSSTRNICRGGMYFETLIPLEIGELLDCRIAVSSGVGDFHFSSRVVRCEQFCSGMTHTFGVAAEFVESFDSSDVKLSQVLSLK